MGIFRKHRRKALWIVPLLVALLVTGCVGIEPYEPRNSREEGPEKGLFTGSEGEFVIFRRADAPETGSVADKTPDEITDGEEQKMDSQEKKTKVKNGEQQP